MTALLAQEISTALAAEMFRQTGMRLCSASAEIQKQKMQSLFKLVTGDVQFKNKVRFRITARHSHTFLSHPPPPTQLPSTPHHLPSTPPPHRRR